MWGEGYLLRMRFQSAPPPPQNCAVKLKITRMADDEARNEKSGIKSSCIPTANGHVSIQRRPQKKRQRACEDDISAQDFHVIAIITDSNIEKLARISKRDLRHFFTGYAEDFRRRHYRMRQEGRLVRLSAHWNGSQIGTIGFKHHAI